MNNLTLRQLRAFRAVATARSFTEAASQLHLTPAALSALVKELEGQLGVRLLDRNTRNVVLSGVGEEFFPLAERVLQDLDDAVLSLTNLKEKRRGLVRIAAPEVMSCTLVPAAMAAFRERYPDVELRFLDVSIEEVLERTRRGDVDVGLATGLGGPDDVLRTPFMRAPLRAAVLQDDALARRRSIAWADLDKRRLLTYFRNSSDFIPQQRDAQDRSVAREVTFVRRINTALAMVQAEMGVTLCPVYASSLAAGFGLKLIRLTDPEIVRDYVLLTRQGHSPTPPVEAFMTFIREFAPGWTRQAHESPGARRG